MKHLKNAGIGKFILKRTERILFVFTLFTLYSLQVLGQCTPYSNCSGTSLQALLETNETCSGCMTKEVKFIFAPEGNGTVNNTQPDFTTCNLKIKGKIEVIGGEGTILKVCKPLKDKNTNVEIPSKINGNEFEFGHHLTPPYNDLIHTFDRTTPLQPDKYAFSLQVLATPGSTVKVTLYRSETTMSIDLTQCNQPNSNFCYLAQGCDGNQPINYVFSYTVGGANNCSSSTPPLEYFIDYTNALSTTETERTYGIYIKNNTSTSATLKEASLVLSSQVLTGNTTCEINGIGDFAITSDGGGSFLLKYVGAGLVINNTFNPQIGKITLSTIMPTRYAAAQITYKPNSGYMKYTYNATSYCCQAGATSNTVKLNENIGYPSCTNDNLTFRVKGEMTDAKTAKITLYAKSKVSQTLNHTWVDLRIIKPSTWTLNNQNMNNCPNTMQNCSYNHSITSTNCVDWTQNSLNNQVWNAKFGICSSNAQNLIANVETEIGSLIFKNTEACSSDQISLDPIFVQLGSSPNDPCVPKVIVDGFPLKGSDYNISGYMNLRCTSSIPNQFGTLSGISVYEKPNGTCSGDCSGDCLLTCFSGANIYKLNVDNNTLFYNSVCRDGAPSVSIEPCKSDEASQFVSTADLVAINKHINGTLLFSEFQQYFGADVNHDKEVSTADMVKIRKIILALEENFSPYQYWSWRFIPTYHKFVIAGTPPFPIPNDPQGCQESYYGTKFDHNYYAIKIGDVNNCKPIIVGNSLANSFSDRPSYQVGDPVKIKIKAGGSFSLEGLQAGLRFNPAQLSYSGINQTSVSTPILITDPDYVGSTQASNGKLRFLWFDPQGGAHGFQSGEDIIELNFTALQPITSTTGLIQLDNTVLESIGINNDSQHTNLSLDGQLGALTSGEERESTTFKQAAFGLELMEAEVIPNPSNNSVMLKVKTPESGIYVISVVDETGKVLIDYQRNLERGINQTILEGAERLSSGMYYYRVLAPSGSSINGKLLRH